MDIEELAISAGLGPILGGIYDGDDMPIECDVYAGLEKLSVIVATAEREACAELLEQQHTWISAVAAANLVRERSN